MNIKVGIVDTDSSFVKRFSDVMNAKYEKLEIFIFPTIKTAQKAAKKAILNLLLLEDSFIDEINIEDFNFPDFKVVFLKNDKTIDENLAVATVCKYMSMEEWYLFICQNCIKEEDSAGGYESFLADKKTCLFLSSGSDFGASEAAIEFCRFLNNKGIIVAGVSPYLESGEATWGVVESVSRNADVTVVVLDRVTDNQLVVPFLNTNVVIFVTDGKHETNKRIKDIISKLPRMLCTSGEEVYKKSYLLYNNFDPIEGSLLEEERISKLGGLDVERNCKAAFEKLETILGV